MANFDKYSGGGVIKQNDQTDWLYHPIRTSNAFAPQEKHTEFRNPRKAPQLLHTKKSTPTDLSFLSHDEGVDDCTELHRQYTQVQGGDVFRSIPDMYHLGRLDRSLHVQL